MINHLRPLGTWDIVAPDQVTFRTGDYADPLTREDVIQSVRWLLLPFNFARTDVILFVYELAKQTEAISDLHSYWMPKLHEWGLKKVPLLIVGAKSDKIVDETKEGNKKEEEKAKEEYQQAMRKEFPNLCVMHCSSMTDPQSVKAVFHRAIEEVLIKEQEREKKEKGKGKGKNDENKNEKEKHKRCIVC